MLLMVGWRTTQLQRSQLLCHTPPPGTGTTRHSCRTLAQLLRLCIHIDTIQMTFDCVVALAIEKLCLQMFPASDGVCRKNMAVVDFLAQLKVLLRDEKRTNLHMSATTQGQLHAGAAWHCIVIALCHA